MVIENSIAEAINFFHMDALSWAVGIKLCCDLQLTLMVGSLYRLLGTTPPNGYDAARADHIFRDFVDAAAQVWPTETDVLFRVQKRGHNPLFLAARFEQTPVSVPWLGRKRPHLQFG